MSSLKKRLFQRRILFYVITSFIIVMAEPIFAQDLSGTWYDYTPNTGNKGQISQIEQAGNRLTFINHYGNSSKGRFLEDKRVIAEDWAKGLKATISDDGKIINWDNGSVWQRSRRWIIDLSGTWYDYTPNTGNKGQISQIEQNGNWLTFINHYGNSSKGRFLEDKLVIAKDWAKGLKATISDDGKIINWDNGSVWQKSRR